MNSLFIVHLGFLNLGPTEIVLILVLAVILFGGRLPDVARSVGKVFFEFKKNVKDLQRDIYTGDFDNAPQTLPKPYYPDSTPDYVYSDDENDEKIDEDNEDSEHAIDNETENEIEGEDAFSETEDNTDTDEKKETN